MTNPDPTSVAVNQPQLTANLQNLPSDTHMLLKVKHTPLSATKLPKNKAFSFLQIRIEPSVLINDEVCTRRPLYRGIMDLLQELNLDAEPKSRASKVETVINALFDSKSLKEAKQKARNLFQAQIKAFPHDTLSLPSALTTT